MNRNALPALLNNHRDYFGLTPFDSLFDELVKGAFPEFGANVVSKGSYPKVNVEDAPEEYIITAELAGLKKDEVSVDLDNDTITISGARKEKGEDKFKNYIVRELKQSSFKRAFILGDNVDKEKISADFLDGILTVKIKKKRPEVPKVTKKKIL